MTIPRWLSWTGLSRGAQLLLTRLCSPAARGVKRRCKRCTCSSCRGSKRRKGRQQHHDPRAPVQRAKNGQAFVRRPLRWFADLAGLRSERQASNLLRELSATPFLWRRWRRPGGDEGGTELTVWLNLNRWFRMVPGWPGHSERKRVSEIVPSSPQRGLGKGEIVGLEGIRADRPLVRILEAEQKQLVARHGGHSPPGWDPGGTTGAA